MTQPGVKKHKHTNNHSMKPGPQSNCVNTLIVIVLKAQLIVVVTY